MISHSLESIHESIRSLPLRTNYTFFRNGKANITDKATSLNLGGIRRRGDLGLRIAALPRKHILLFVVSSIATPLLNVETDCEKPPSSIPE
jgi:hypothetical protein